MPSIIIDAGHGGNDPGDIYDKRDEKDDNLKLALAVGEILQDKYHYNVIYTRTEDTYLSQLDRARIANTAGGDLLLTFHRITGDIPVIPPGLSFYIYKYGGFGEKVANQIGKELQEVGFPSYRIDLRNIPMFRETEMPSVMAAIGYINSDIDNDFYDTHLEEMAEAIARGVVAAFSDSDQAVSVTQRLREKQQTPAPIFRIQVGEHSGYENAIEQQRLLMRKGYPAEVVKHKEGYTVELGTFRELDTAAHLEGILRWEGYQTMILT